MGEVELRASGRVRGLTLSSRIRSKQKGMIFDHEDGTVVALLAGDRRRYILLPLGRLVALLTDVETLGEAYGFALIVLTASRHVAS